MATVPNRFSDPVGYRKWEWTQLSVTQLLAHKEKAMMTIIYLDDNHAIQRSNNLNPPKKQAEIERKNRAPHLAIIQEINEELTRRN